jgi:hypothetical protein
MIEINPVGPGRPIYSEEIEHERFKEIKSRAGKLAFIMSSGKDARVARVTSGISRSQGALKWIEEVFEHSKWKSS